MSEVDRLSTTGTYPALPIAAKRRSREDSKQWPTADHEDAAAENPQAETQSQAPRAPKSLIDEYA